MLGQRGGLACKDSSFKLFQNCILEFIILGQAQVKSFMIINLIFYVLDIVLEGEI